MNKQQNTETLQIYTAAAIGGMQCYNQPFFCFWHADSIRKMKEIESKSVNCILTDPPYKYLKNQKLEVDFDETIFFNEAKRVLKPDGFIVLFGRGTSFYRWNTMLADLGFNFKEEIIWNKKRNSIPGLPLMRRHETVSIFTKKTGKINRVYLDYFEKKQFDMQSLHNDIKRIASSINSKEIEAVRKFIETGKIDYEEQDTVHFFKHGFKAKSRAANTLNIMNRGLCESSIIEILRDHYSAIHPTQKPVRLLERLLALTTKEGDLVIDPFSGSCSTGIACLNMKRKFIGYEIDLEYYKKAVDRLKTIEPRLF